ncbi:thioredoxin domain-containing protein [Bacillus sp. PK3_68]|uniref:thioredoxin family protein n=1 Tax=Bacillus sp. PK3_68 TaxID=2027408 RepID=UPI000E757CF0|nr:thioredoxin domain-containing protein [Bacillus sp. PK3_68]RJS50058.1 thiol reductase thioredoxin [Bacillus sp. PK3_68]
MIEVNKENFESEVLQADQPVIVDFWGPSCQPCLKLMPEVEALSEAYGDQVKIVKLNSAENRRVCINHRVMGLPAFLVFKDGKEVKRIAGGDLTKGDIENLIVQSI